MILLAVREKPLFSVFQELPNDERACRYDSSALNRAKENLVGLHAQGIGNSNRRGFLFAVGSMARINVEDDLDSDPRFHALIRMLGGDLDRAYGKLVRFWKVAQKFWGKEKQPVPFDLFKIGDFAELLEVGFALREGEAVYASESDDRFAWYLEQCRKSKRGAEARKQKADEKKGGNEPQDQPAGNPDEARGKPAGNPRVIQSDPAGHPLTLTPIHTLNINNPPKAPPTRRELATRAQGIADEILGSFETGKDPRTVEEQLSDDARAFIAKRYGSLSTCWSSLARSFRQGRELQFGNALVKSLKAHLASTAQKTGPPGDDLHTVN